MGLATATTKIADVTEKLDTYKQTIEKIKVDYIVKINNILNDLETVLNKAAYKGTVWATPKVEKLTKKLIKQLDEHFRCFKNWVQWQLKPENVEIDDGDLDKSSQVVEPFKYQEEGSECKICGNNCTKDKSRNYLKVDTAKPYPKI